jgi:hypothetical protein
MPTQAFLTSPVVLHNEQAPANIDPLSGPEEPDRLRVLLIGPRQGVISTIHTLHALGFAEPGNWSPLLPGPQPGTVISILTRKVN